MFYYHVTIIQNKQQQKESTWYGRSQLDTHYLSLHAMPVSFWGRVYGLTVYLRSGDSGELTGEYPGV